MAFQTIQTYVEFSKLDIRHKRGTKEAQIGMGAKEAWAQNTVINYHIKTKR